jgi:hypothetical protein
MLLLLLMVVAAAALVQGQLPSWGLPSLGSHLLLIVPVRGALLPEAATLAPMVAAMAAMAAAASITSVTEQVHPGFQQSV